MNNLPKVALVLSSGGARGIAHIGVIQELERLGYEIGSICGSSIGAVIGGLYAAGKLNEYRDWICSLDRMDVFNLMDFNIRSFGFIKGEKVFKHMAEWLKNINIEDLGIPFSCIGTDIYNRKEHVFTEGNLLKAVRASVAIPGILPPVKYPTGYIFDGGVSNPIPINRIQKNKNDLLIAVDLNAFVPNFKKEFNTLVKNTNKKLNTTDNSRLGRLKMLFQNAIIPMQKGDDTKTKDTPSYFSVMNGMFDMMQEQISRFTIETYPPDILVKIPRDICSTFEFHRSNYLIELGKSEIQKALTVSLGSNSLISDQ